LTLGAAAAVKQEKYVIWRGYRTEVANVLENAVFVEQEVLRLQGADGPVLSVEHSDIDRYQRNVNSDCINGFLCQNASGTDTTDPKESNNKQGDRVVSCYWRSHMTKILRFLLIVGAVTLFFSPFAIGTPEFSKKESKSCLFCHTAMGKPDLNDAGKYYKAHNNSLEGYQEKKK
jgi:hypothetical protein